MALQLFDKPPHPRFGECIHRYGERVDHLQFLAHELRIPSFDGLNQPFLEYGQAVVVDETGSNFRESAACPLRFLC